jgi:hypothetical protein
MDILMLEAVNKIRVDPQVEEVVIVLELQDHLDREEQTQPVQMIAIRRWLRWIFWWRFRWSFD